MTAIAFDTLKYADRLENAGVPRAQAKVQAESLAEVIGGSEIITREYLDARLDVRLRESELRLDARIRESELRLDARLAETKADLTRWVVGAGILQTSLIIGVLLKVAKLL